MDERTGPPAQGAPALGAAVAGIWEKFRGATLARVSALDEAVLALLGGALDAEQRRHAEREAHKLAGSVGTFGFARGSEIAREIELMLGGSTPPAPGEVLKLSELAVALREELERPGPRAAQVEDARSFLLVVDEDREFTERVAMEAEGRGLAVRVVERESDLRSALAIRSPDLVIIDPFFAGDTETGLRLLAEITARESARPVIAVSAAGAFSLRVEAARLGARAFLEKPASPAAVVAAALRMLPRSGATGTVLVMDDDPHILEIVRALLEPPGFHVAVHDDPTTFWDTLEAVRPDLLILDVDLPFVNGLELCRVVRNESRWSTLPVIVLTARTDAETVQRVFAAGADDYVAKPVVGPELTTRVANRLERVRLYHQLADVDALTGVANRRKSEERIRQLVSLAARQKQPLVLAVIDLDHFRSVNEGHGHAVGDDVLRRVSKRLRKALRDEDVIGRWAGEEFVIAAFGVEKQALARRLEDVLADLQAEGVDAGATKLSLTFTAGVAAYPVDGSDLETVYRAADAALQDAKSAGRNRVLATVSPGVRPGGAEEADVVLVEDDPVLAELLLHAVGTHGYAARWLRDGEAALQALRGPDPELRARVILLDVNLPGRDGLSVLRELTRSGITAASRVIMLTVRSTEAEVVRSLELGAFDHVAKPFSVPVLLRRIHTAMQRG